MQSIRDPWNMIVLVALSMLIFMIVLTRQKIKGEKIDPPPKKIEQPVEEDEDIRLLKIVASRNSGPSEIALTWKWETGCFHEEDDALKCTYCQDWNRL